MFHPRRSILEPFGIMTANLPPSNSTFCAKGWLARFSASAREPKASHPVGARNTGLSQTRILPSLLVCEEQVTDSKVNYS